MKKTVKAVVAAAILTVAIIVLSSTFYTVRENEFKCVLRFSQIVKTVNEAGLHAKIPFVDELQTYPKTKLIYDMKPSPVFTSDSKAMNVDSFIVWQISDPLLFYQTLGTLNNAEGRLDVITYNILKNVIGKIEQNDIVSPADEKSRDYLNNTVAESVREQTPTYGIEVIDVKIKKFELPEENEKAVFDRMISDRNKTAALYIAEGEKEANFIHNEVDKEVNIIVSNAEAEAEKIIADGEAEYMRILAEAYDTESKQDFYIFLRGLDALKASLSGKDKTIILDKDSELAKILIKP